MHQAPKNLNEFSTLLEIVKALRSETGCPWDKEQTHKSLAPFAIEEAFELAEALETSNRAHMIEELGDLLLQVALHSEIGRQNQEFNIEDVLYSINEKMIRRHPHVFGSAQAENSKEVLNQWDQIKAQEKKNTVAKENSFGLPPHLTALMMAQKIGSKTKKMAFDWSKPNEVLQKIHEELQEVTAELTPESNKEKQMHEIGDLLFSVVQLARHLDIDAEQALRTTNQRFESRFFKMIELSQKSPEAFKALSLDEKESFWEKAKQSSCQ